MASALAPSLPGLDLSVRKRPRGQLLKWVGNKFRQAELIARMLPDDVDTYYEPFVGTGAVLATVAPNRGVAGDALAVLVEFHRLVQTEPELLVSHYSTARSEILSRGRKAYEEVKGRFNAEPNPLDLLVLSRTCYGGVVRFTRDGRISTPMGPHTPMAAEKLAGYMAEWRERLAGTRFVHCGFQETMAEAGKGSVVYCDPPYLHGQSILYGAQDFRAADLWRTCEGTVAAGAKVVVSMDGWRRSGEKEINLDLPEGIFLRELLIERGGCMLRRFQMEGEGMEQEQVADRLLLSW
jgi:DNA adenine methylase